MTPFVPVYQALRGALPEWRALGAPAWVLDTIEHGIKIEWASEPTRFRCREYPLNAADAAFLAEEIQRELDERYIQVVADPEEIAELQCIASDLVAHTAAKPRAVFDFSHANDFILNAACRYETLYDPAQVLHPGDALLSWDIQDAYHHLVVRPADRTYLAFRACGRVFLPITMPLGARLAPRIWTKFCRPQVEWLRARGFRVITYVDDFGGAPPATGDDLAMQAEAVAGWQLVHELLQRLGLRIHPVKGVQDSQTAMQLLGHVIDTRAGMFFLPRARVTKVVGLAVGLARYAAAHHRWVPFFSLRRFCGTAVSGSLSVPSARFHLRSLFTALTYRRPRSGDARLGHQASGTWPGGWHWPTTPSSVGPSGPARRQCRWIPTRAGTAGGRCSATSSRPAATTGRSAAAFISTCWSSEPSRGRCGPSAWKSPAVPS